MILAAALAFVPLAACAPDAAEGPRSGILITLDTTRADAIGCYGRTTGVTPHLDRLCSEAVLYETAHTVAPLTLPAHASMLTGLYPLRHGVRDNGLWPLPQEAETLAETAQRAGIQTAAIIAARVLGPRYGLDQGFETYDALDSEGKSEQRWEERPASEVVDAAVAWIESRDRDRPFFLWVHLFDPHSPFILRAEVRAAVIPNSEYPNVKYLGEVAYMDREIGRLLAALDADGALSESLLLVIGDHGEALKEHGEITHGAYCYEQTLRVPMLLRYSDGYRRGERSTEMSSVVDVYPTFAEAMGLAGADRTDGMSLYRRTVPAERGVYFESFSGFLAYGWSPLAGWMDAEGKYLHSSEPQFFDLRADPGENENLILERAADVPRYVRAIAELTSLPTLEVGAALEIDEAMVAHLRDLGYGGIGLGPDSVPSPLAPSDLPSPQSMQQEYWDTIQGSIYSNSGQFPEAEQVLKRVLQVNPRNYTALDLLSLSLVRQGRYDEAIPHLQLLVQEGPRKASQFFNLGVCQQMVGNVDEAIVVLKAAVELAPFESRFLRRLGGALQEAGRTDEAQRYAERLREFEAGK
jgi:arylsulfatase A-like enzyme